MERRVLIAIFLCFLFLYFWQALVVKPVPKLARSATTGQQAGASRPQAAPGSPEAGSLQQAAEVPAPETPKAPPPVATTLIGDTIERDIKVETRDVIAVFTNRGARLKSWRLKRYLDRDRQPQELIVRLDLQPLPFTLRVPDEQKTGLLNDSLYVVAGAPTGDSAANSATRLRFEYSSASDHGELHAIKEFEIKPAGYVVVFSTNLATPYTVQWGPAVGDIGENSRYVKKAGGLFSQNMSIARKAPKDFAAQPTYDGEFEFIGVDDNYFLVSALAPGPSKVTYQAVSIPPPANSKDPARDLVAFSLEPARASQALGFFAGPKDFDVLAAVGGNLREAIDFGWFKLIVIPLLKNLKRINQVVGNYGWSIIILTVVLNALLFPFRHWSVVSMRKMQQIQPEVKSIQDRYAKYKTTDPARQKMNQELMALYKERGVNPALGCVPMLLTMPFLIAFYSLLSTAIEIRGAPFVGWIHDLSLHDPFYVTPVLMGGTMVWQQKLAPATGVDPAQQKMMMLMPAVFTFMFLWAPAGVAVYWLMSNLWGIGQQYLTNYLLGPLVVRTVRPAAERQVKRVGAGKTEAAAREQ